MQQDKKDSVPLLDEQSPIGGIKHKRADCTSTRAWLHVFGEWYCSDCWPCADEAMMVREAIAGDPVASGGDPGGLPE